MKYLETGIRPLLITDGSVIGDKVQNESVAIVSSKNLKFQRRAEARPNEVLDAALQLFMSQGFEATRVEDIAKAAGISKATVYLYFPSKLALLEGLVRRSLSPTAALAEHALGGFEGSAKEAISAALAIACEKVTDPKVLAIPVIVMREGTRFPEIAQLYYSEILAHIMPALISVIERGMASGEFRKVDAALTIRNIIGPLILHLLVSAVFEIGDTSPEGIRKFLGNHLDVLMNGLSKGAENG